MTVELITALIDAHRAEDEERFRAVGLQAVAAQTKAGHTVAAARIERALTRPMPQSLHRAARWQAQTAPKGVEVEACSVRLEDLSLEPSTLEAVQRVLREHEFGDQLVAYGLEPCRSLLLYGPPGNGKTSLARCIAHALARPFHRVLIDGVVGSYLGETASAIRNAFNHAAKAPSVIFLDELDALAKHRSDANDVGETRRIVNSMLQIIDDASAQKTLVIAATNEPGMIDAAIWRRFEVALKVDMPDEAAVACYVLTACDRMKMNVEGRERAALEVARLARQVVSMSGLERALKRVAKEAVLAGRNGVRLDDIITCVQACRER